MITLRSKTRFTMPLDHKKETKSITIRNKQASFAYIFLDKYVAGIVLTGTEIKSIRAGKAS